MPYSALNEINGNNEAALKFKNSKQKSKTKIENETKKKGFQEEKDVWLNDEHAIISN